MTHIDKIRQYYSDVDQSTAANGRIFEVRDDKVQNITQLFAENAVYIRNTDLILSNTYNGIQKIGDFFSKARPLYGEHKIISYSEKDGIALSEPLSAKMQRLPKSECKTVIAKGIFSGKMNVTKAEDGKRIIESSHAVDLGFTDYWVLHKDKVVYRQSDISPVRSSVKKLEVRPAIGRY